MATKTYYSRIPHSTFVCSKGSVITFTGGKAFVEDERQQAEIEAAISCGGNQLMTEQQYKDSVGMVQPTEVVSQPQKSALEMLKEKAASNQQ